VDVKGKAFDKVYLITVSGEVLPEDIVALDQEIPELCKVASLLVLSFKKSKVPAGFPQVLNKIRDKHGLKKNKLSFVSPTIAGMDYNTFEEALEQAGTSDSHRVSSVLKANADLKERQKEIDALAIQRSNLLRHGLGKKESEEPLTADQMEKMLFILRDEMKKQQYLFKAIGTEIAALKKADKESGATAPTEEEQAAVKNTRKQAKQALKGSGIL
jgi:hypothetical protein